jgi:hypothetical protein
MLGRNSPLILRSIAQRCVSKDEARTNHGLMVRDGAIAGVACVNLATKRLLTKRRSPILAVMAGLVPAIPMRGAP